MAGLKMTDIERLQAQLLAACEIGDEELAHALTEKLIGILAEEKEKPFKPIVWNTDPEWMDYCATVLEMEIRKIAIKSTADEALREDCENEAREAIYQIFPKQVREYEGYKSGDITVQKWKTTLKNYCKNAIRNAILTYLDSPKTGNWYVGRTSRIRMKDGRRIKVFTGPRYSSLEELAENAGLQISEHGEVSWDIISNDGMKHGLEHDQRSMWEEDNG